MGTFIILMVIGLVCGLFGFFLLNNECSKILSILLLSFGISTFAISTFGAVINAGYITGRESVLNEIKIEQERKQIEEQQRSLIEELGLTDEQLDILRQTR